MRTVIDDHLDTLPEPQRSTLLALRATLRTVLPDAEETIKYRMPCFTVDGKAVAGFDGFKDHNSYFPHSGGVISRIDSVPSWCSTEKGTLRFPIDRPLSLTLVRKLVKVRLAEIAERGR